VRCQNEDFLLKYPLSFTSGAEQQLWQMRPLLGVSYNNHGAVSGKLLPTTFHQ